MENEQQLRNYARLMTGLFIAAVIVILFLLFSRSRVANNLAATTTERDSLLVARTNLTHEVDSLGFAFQTALTENDSLRGSMSKLEKLVAEKDALVQRIRTQSTNSTAGLRREINQLRQLRGELEGAMAQLQAENQTLRADNERLTGENVQLTNEKGQLTSQVGDLQKFNSTLQDQVAKLTRAGVKASAFRVEVARRPNKLTTSARRTREIGITFDLVDLPEEFQGAHTLYLVVTDVNGALLPSSGTNAKASIPTPGGTPLEIVAQQAKEVDLSASQRLSFNYPVEEKLKAGTYIATVYADFGILGSSSFRLN
jgi:uncharacterized protein YdcH (DUF465 family)